ncbi:MAG: DUF2313 domain-containing protein [Clostridium sp.]|uniref:putative phage tail protein n=1 Tax=Clostridium sp. TaxID=1506 RepID=UPI0025BAF467|nr:putative phage tail protein [Clostridium sp.]MCF0149587.1 DUF2313 domain-containing protein [Clostridium sp.]
MIDFINYTVDGKTYKLIDNGDETWSKSVNAPNVAGNYNLLLEVSSEGRVTYIDSSDSRYNFYLKVIASTERVTFLEKLVPEFISEVDKFKLLYDTENISFDELHSNIEKVKSDVFISTSSNDAVERIETFINVKGQGNLEQRRSYIKSLLQKSNKLNEKSIKDVVNAITGSDCIVMFFTSDEKDNPITGNSLLRVQVLSPDNYKDYRYDDIARTLKPLVPSHIKLIVVKFFATWNDIQENYADWNTVRTMKDWQTIKNYIPPQ